jgi:hypothetical protein
MDTEAKKKSVRDISLEITSILSNLLILVFINPQRSAIEYAIPTDSISQNDLRIKTRYNKSLGTT